MPGKSDRKKMKYEKGNLIVLGMHTIGLGSKQLKSPVVSLSINKVLMTCLLFI